MRSFAALALAGVLVTAASASARPGTWPPKARHSATRAAWVALEKRVAAATVMLPDLGCAGALVRSTREVATAAHCVPEGASILRVVLPGGTTESAVVRFLDVNADLALLVLATPAAAQPLSIATTPPRRGDRLLFVGRTDRPSQPQLTRVERLGRCPSLPLLPNAVFTGLDAYPGDSGSPLVDAQGRVVALVHGGARCEIAVPTAALSRQKLPPRATTSPPPPAVSKPAPPAPAPADSSDASRDGDGFVFEKTPNGFRFHWSFHWQSGG